MEEQKPPFDHSSVPIASWQLFFPPTSMSDPIARFTTEKCMMVLDLQEQQEGRHNGKKSEDEMLSFPDSTAQVADRQTDRHPVLLCPTHLMAINLASLTSTPKKKSHIPPAQIPSHPHARSPQEAQNPRETSAYFLGGDFDLQELCFPGQHLPWGVDPDKDRSLAFAL